MLFFGLQLTRLTEHKALAALVHSERSVSTRVSKRLLALDPFDSTIRLIAGMENIVSHSRSRILWPLAVQNLESSDDSVETLDTASETASEIRS